MYYDEENVIVTGAILLWDGITVPETKDDGKQRWSIKVALPNTDPQLAEVDALVKKELNAGIFKGRLPANGQLPVRDVDPTAMDGRLPAHKAFSSATYRGAPQVYDLQGNELDPMSYKAQLYPGAIVDVIVSAWSYDDPRNKGIGLNINGIRIRDPKAPALPVGAGFNAAAAFGAGAAATAQPQAAGRVMSPDAAFTYEQYVASGWTDEQLINNGLMQPPAAAAPPAAGAPPPATAQPPAAGAPPPATAQPPAAGRTMTPAAQYTYEQYVASGWTDEQLIAQGLMTFT